MGVGEKGGVQRAGETIDLAAQHLIHDHHEPIQVGMDVVRSEVDLILDAGHCGLGQRVHAQWPRNCPDLVACFDQL